MCHPEIVQWFIDEALEYPECFRGKKILEVGSKYVNGSVRPFIEKLGEPESYTGIDIQSGRYVDVICPVDHLVSEFGLNRFDVVVSTEALEHFYDWKVAIKNMKGVLKPGGLIYLTTRSLGTPMHGFPYDYWRFEVDDFKKIFQEYDILWVESAKDSHGVFLKAKKPLNPAINNLEIKLYNIAIGKKSSKPRTTSLIRRFIYFLGIALGFLSERILCSL